MLNVFVAVGETRGFSAAANRLGLSPAAVTRSIAGLKTRLGVELLQRTTRNVRLTEAGQRYLDDIRRIVMELGEVNDAATDVPAGQLVVAAPESFGKFFVMPCVSEYLARFPHVDLVAGFFDRVVDLEREGVHVAIGMGRLRDPAVIATEVGHVRYVLCASHAYLDRHGTPQHPVDLLNHAVIGMNAGTQPIEWKFGSAGGGGVVRLNPRLAVTTVEAAIEAAERGLGVVRVLSYQAAGPLANGRLRVVLDQFGEPFRPVYVLRRERYRDVPKVSEFVRMLVEHLSNDAALQSQRRSRSS